MTSDWQPRTEEEWDLWTRSRVNRERVRWKRARGTLRMRRANKKKMAHRFMRVMSLDGFWLNRMIEQEAFLTVEADFTWHAIPLDLAPEDDPTTPRARPSWRDDMRAPPVGDYALSLVDRGNHYSYPQAGHDEGFMTFADVYLARFGCLPPATPCRWSQITPELLTERTLRRQRLRAEALSTEWRREQERQADEEAARQLRLAQTERALEEARQELALRVIARDEQRWRAKQPKAPGGLCHWECPNCHKQGTYTFSAGDVVGCGNCKDENDRYVTVETWRSVEGMNREMSRERARIIAKATRVSP